MTPNPPKSSGLVAKAVSAPVPAKVVALPGPQSAIKPASPVRIVPDVDVPPHMASMIGAKRGVGWSPTGLENRAANALFDGPVPEVTEGRSLIAQTRVALNTVLKTALQAVAQIEAVEKLAAESSLFRTLTQVEALDLAALAEVRKQCAELVEAAKPKLPEPVTAPAAEPEASA